MNQIIKQKVRTFLNERYFADLYPKNKYVKLDFEKYPELLNNIFDLVTKAYGNKNGHFDIKSPNDLKKLDFWFASDINDDPYADVALGGKKTPYGYKITTSGQNGSLDSKKHIINKISNILNSNGFYFEIDTKMARIIPNVNKITNKEDIEKVIGKEVQMNNDGSYNRMIDNQPVTKVLMGNPKI